MNLCFTKRRVREDAGNIAILRGKSPESCVTISVFLMPLAIWRLFGYVVVAPLIGWRRVAKPSISRYITILLSSGLDFYQPAVLLHCIVLYFIFGER